MREVQDNQTVYQREVANRAGDRFLMRILPYRAGVETSGVVLTLTNITNLIESQRQTLLVVQRFERAIAATSDGIWDWPDVRSEDMWWSPACYRLLGYEPGEFPSKFQEWLKRIHPVDRKLITRGTVPESDQCYVEMHRDMEYRLRHKSGEFRWYRQTTLVDHDENGNPVRATGSISDIHQRKRAELQAENEIQQRDSFLAMLSHELRNPMAAVMGALELLGHEDGSATAEDGGLDVRELLDVIRRQVDRMSHRLDDLLEVTRIQQNKTPLKKSTTDLVDLFQEVVIAAQTQIEAKHQNLDVSVPDGPVLAFVDPGRLVQAQLILLENASKHSAEYEDIHYQLTIEGDHAVISVRDRGRGIADQEVESIFDPFSRLGECGEDEPEETGVGLSMVRSILQAHGGSIQAGSEGLDGGAVFTVRLPLAQSDEPAAAATSAKPAEVSPRHSGRLLIVEDNVDVARMLDGVMSRAGFEVVCAIDGYEALELFDDFQPAVAVVDIGLPGMNGYELARGLRKRPGGDSVFLIAVTGYGMTCDRAESKASGFDRHLVKPVNNDHLLSVIEGFFVARSKK
jgi:two-component system CheB/CheR fusion protein